MSGPVIHVTCILSARPTIGVDGRQITLQVDVTEQQRREIALQMIGGMGSQDAYTWARAEFPEWFKEQAHEAKS